MKSHALSLLSIFLSITISSSQDIITTKTGEDILGKISEVGPIEIKYKKFDNQDGPLFILLKSEVLMIRYENGTKDIFAEEEKSTTKPAANSTDLFGYEKGQMDAVDYYQGYKGAGTGTLIVGLLSPLAGLVPAIACSSTPPKDRNLMYPNSEQMKNADYSNGYKQRSKKIKSKKVWKNWWIAFGVNVVLAIALQAGN